MTNIVLAGVPRSGSTLTCNLLNELPDAVALHEPMEIGNLTQLDDEQAICAEINGFFANTRTSLRETLLAPSKHINGAVPKNSVQARPNCFGLREPAARKGMIKFEKPLSENHLLAVKHNSAFAALTPLLKDHFNTFAVVRNPVSTLCSWNSVKMAVRDGHAPAAENLAPALKETLAAMDDLIDRQVHLISWFFGQYALLPKSRVIRYENIIASGGRCLDVITASAAQLAEPLHSSNRNKFYDAALVPILIERLLDLPDSSIWTFYSREDIEALGA